MAECAVQNCTKEAKNAGFCWAHYCRKRRHGSFDDPRKSVEQRFAENVQKSEDGCWLWVGSCYSTNMGYGRMYVSGKSILAHRLSYQLHHGDIPEGKLILHHCDNPKCVNPEHLYAGDYQDNADDRESRNRHPHDLRGELIANSKLTEDRVKVIYQDSRSYSQIARDYNISRSTVHLIKARRIWRHVEV